jgi:hypothetical protein
MRKQRQRTAEQRSMRMVRENIDAQAASTDGRATFYANGQTHMFERKNYNQKTTGGFKCKKTKPSIFFFSYLKRYSNTHFYTPALVYSDKTVQRVNKKYSQEPSSSSRSSRLIRAIMVW